MADEDTTSQDDVASVFRGVSSGGGTAVKRPAQARRDAEAQNAADAAAATTGAPTAPDDARTAAEVFRPGLTKTAFSQLPTKESEGGFWNTAKSLARDVVGDVGVHVPGSGAPQPYQPRNPHQVVQETHTEAGLKRGVRDVTDTLRLTSTSEEEKQRFEAEHGDSNWAGVGRVIGQTAATAPLAGGAGALVGRAAGFVPGAVGRAAQWLTGGTRAATLPGRAVQLAGKGAATGATEAALTSASSDMPLGEQMALGGAVGCIAGPVIGAATKVADVARGYYPGIRRDVAELADQFRNATRTAANPAGVTVPAPQMSTNPTVRIMGDAFRTMPGAGTDAADLARQRGVQRAIADVAGLDADRFGTAEMRTMRNNIQADYRAALNQVGPIRGGPPLANDLANAATDASRFTDAATVGYVGRAVREVSDTFARGPITPQAYRALTNSDGALAKIEKAAPQAAQPYLRAVREAVEARMYASAPPDVAQQLKQLDARYRAMHTIRPLAAKATVGDIGLGGLQQEMINVSQRFDPKNASFAFTGGGRMGDIARGGKAFFGHIPESGTAPRLQAYDFARNPAALLGLIPGVALGRPIQRYVRGPGFSGRMIDTSLGGPTPDVGRSIKYGVLGPIDRERE